MLGGAKHRDRDNAGGCSQGRNPSLPLRPFSSSGAGTLVRAPLDWLRHISCRPQLNRPELFPHSVFRPWKPNRFLNPIQIIPRPTNDSQSNNLRCLVAVQFLHPPVYPWKHGPPGFDRQQHFPSPLDFPLPPINRFDHPRMNIHASRQPLFDKSPGNPPRLAPVRARHQHHQFAFHSLSPPLRPPARQPSGYFFARM